MVAGQDIMDVAGTDQLCAGQPTDQLCAGQPGGCEAAVHAVRSMHVPVHGL